MRLWHAILALLLGACCGGATPASRSPMPATAPSPPQPTATPIRVLMLTATAGFRHESIAVARQTMADLSARSGLFTVTATEAVSEINATTLGSTDVLMFTLTTGELPFSVAQKDAIAAFINNGGGFIGFHSATDTLYGWPEYGRIVGAYFKEHPWTKEGAVVIEDRSHAITAGLGGSFRLVEEFYTFQRNPRDAVHVLLSLDAASVGADGDYPLAWTQTIGRGRSYYDALGHFDDTWRDAGFQNMTLNAIRWVSGRS